MRMPLLTALIALAATAAAAQPAHPCAELTRAGLFPRTVITAAQPVEATDKPPAPVHCEVTGRIDERMGRDGKPYAIGFHLRLPDAWNGRFFFQGGGGADGILGTALGPIGNGQADNALTRGYAVVSTDAGHTASRDGGPSIGGVAFGLDPQARLDYGYHALDVVTRISKQIVEQRYGRKPEYSYFVGCSNGGRQGLVAASRFPDAFDGIVAGDPGFNLPKAAVAEAWDSQAFAGAATERDAAGQPYLPTSLTPDDLNLVSRAILDRCDARDGLRDGIVGDARACRFDPRELQCHDAKDASCLSAAQVTALARVFGGTKTRSGKEIYSDWPWDPGIGAPGWRAWKLGAANPARANSAINMTLGAGALPYIFTTPPDAVAAADLARYIFALDIDRAADAIRRHDGDYTQSSMQFMTPPDTGLGRFRRRKGKLLMYHGAADPVFSLNDTVDTFDGELRAHSDSMRLFVVPGMNHCGGGPATDQFDVLTPLVDWVEKGIAPDRIVGTANPDSGFAGRTRPLCPYPEQARYVGSGDIDNAKNFVCTK
jgi:feruloyl esterase